MAVVGQRVGHYEVREEIGRGGMAVVYVARQTDLDRLVALKELPAFHAADAAFAERFSRESRIAGSLSHPNVVVVFEYFEADGTPFIAMEYVGRGSLRPHVGRMSLAQVGGVMEATLSALSHAESRGIVHRDLKPENLMVTAEGTVKVADFGIAKALGDLASRGFRTATGTTIGTPAYMAPEQALGAEVTGATDLYAVGVVAFELLTGRVPFTAESPMAVLFSHVNEPPPALRELRPELDERVDRWVARMLAKAPADRPPTALAAWEELEETLTGSLGPLWRRSARLLDDSAGERGATPLTPAPFDDEADGYVTFGARAAPPVAPAPAPASPVPPVEPAEPAAPVEPVAPVEAVAPVAPIPPVEPVAADVPAFSVSPSLLDFGSVVAGEPVEPRALAVVPLGDRTMAVEVEADDPRIHVVRDGLAVRVSIVAAAAGTLDGAVLLHAAGTRVAVPVRAQITAAAPTLPEPVPSPAAASVDERRPSRRRNIAIGLAAAAVAVVAGIFGLTRGGSGGAPSAATTSTPPVSSATTRTATAPATTATLPPLDDDAFGIEWSTDVYSADPRGPVVRIGPTGPSASVDAPAPPRSIAAANYGVLLGTDRGAFWRSFDLQGTWHRLVADPAPFIYSDGGLPTGIIVLRAGAYRVCGVPPPGSDPPTAPPACGAPLADVPHGLGTASENGGTGVYEVPEGFGGILVVDDAALRTYEVSAGAISPVRSIPLAPDRGGHGTPIPYGGQVYVPVDGGVAIIDPASGRRVRRIALEATPAAIWIVPGRGLLYAALPTVNAVVRVPLGAGGGRPSTYRHGDRPVAVAGSLQPDKASRALFVAYAGDRSVWRLDPSRVEHPTCVARAGRRC